MQKVLEVIRGFDLFAVPVQLNYKGQKAFNTAVGGCCSLILTIGFISYAAYVLKEDLVMPELTSQQKFEYVQL